MEQKDKNRLGPGLKAPVKINLYTQSLMKATHLHPAGAGLKYVTVCPCKLAATDRCAATRDEAGQCANSSERNAPPCQTRTHAHVRTDTANHKSRAGEMNGWSSVQDTPAGLAARGSGGGIAASRAAARRPA